MVTKGLLYYSDNRLEPTIMRACQAQLLKCVNSHRLVSVSLLPMEFGENIILPLERGVLTMHKQVLAGLERMDADIVFLCEHDVLYHPSHFDFVPERNDVFYYNTNIWRVRYPDGHAVWTDDLQQTSGICADWYLLHSFYIDRLEKLERYGFDRHYEPGPKTSQYQTVNWKSEYPNIDIRHGKTLTKSKWSPDEFRNKRYAKGWKEASEVSGWGVTEGRFDEFLKDIR